MCGFAGAGAAGKEPGFSLIKNRNGVQDKKSLLLCCNQEGKTQCMKNIFCMIFIIGKQTAAVLSVSVVLGVLITIIDMIVQYGVDFLVK